MRSNNINYTFTKKMFFKQSLKSFAESNINSVPQEVIRKLFKFIENNKINKNDIDKNW